MLPLEVSDGVMQARCESCSPGWGFLARSGEFASMPSASRNGCRPFLGFHLRFAEQPWLCNSFANAPHALLLILPGMAQKSVGLACAPQLQLLLCIVCSRIFTGASSQQVLVAPKRPQLFLCLVHAAANWTTDQSAGSALFPPQAPAGRLPRNNSISSPPFEVLE